MISAWTCSDDAELAPPSGPSQPPPPSSHPSRGRARHGEREHERELISATWPDPDPVPQSQPHCHLADSAAPSLPLSTQRAGKADSQGGDRGMAQWLRGPCPCRLWYVRGLSVAASLQHSQAARHRVRENERERKSPWWPAAVDRRMTVGWCFPLPC